MPVTLEELGIATLQAYVRAGHLSVDCDASGAQIARAIVFTSYLADEVPQLEAYLAQPPVVAPVQQPPPEPVSTVLTDGGEVITVKLTVPPNLGETAGALATMFTGVDGFLEAHRTLAIAAAEREAAKDARIAELEAALRKIQARWIGECDELRAKIAALAPAAPGPGEATHG